MHNRNLGWLTLSWAGLWSRLWHVADPLRWASAQGDRALIHGKALACVARRLNDEFATKLEGQGTGFHHHEASRSDRVYLTQPMGQGQVADYTWAQVLDQARRMAAHLQSYGLPRGARIAILSKNCAHFIMSELAIWMVGFTTVAIFPTETAEPIGYMLDHSEASVLFVGKLDTWEAQKPGVNAALPRIAFPLAPDSALNDYEGWDAIVGRTEPLDGRPQRAEDELAMIIYTAVAPLTNPACRQRLNVLVSRARALLAEQQRRPLQ